jgi:hypothetical protein
VKESAARLGGAGAADDDDGEEEEEDEADILGIACPLVPNSSRGRQPTNRARSAWAREPHAPDSLVRARARTTTMSSCGAP